MTGHDIEITATWVCNHGYPYRAVCSCGWKSAPYVSESAALCMADWHEDQVLETVDQQRSEALKIPT